MAERQSTVSWDDTKPLANLTQARMRLRLSADMAMNPSARASLDVLAVAALVEVVISCCWLAASISTPTAASGSLEGRVDSAESAGAIIARYGQKRGAARARMAPLASAMDGAMTWTNRRDTACFFFDAPQYHPIASRRCRIRAFIGYKWR